MTNEQYLAALQDLRDRQIELDQEKAQLHQDYLDSLSFKVGDEVYYTPFLFGSSSSSRELKGIVFKVEVSQSLYSMCVFVYYTVCPPTKTGTLPKVARNSSYGTEENLKLRKAGDKTDD